MCDHESMNVLMNNLTAEDLAGAIQEHNRVTAEEMAFIVRNELKECLKYEDPIGIFHFLVHWQWCLVVATKYPQNHQYVNQNNEIVTMNFDELESYELCAAILAAFIRVRALSI